MLNEAAPFINRIGFLQGRLSDPIGANTEAFRWDRWRNEFPTAQKCGFGIMEWTIGQEHILMNALMSASGRDEIRQLCGEFEISIPSLSADFVTQAPFYRVCGPERLARLDVLAAVVEACADIGIGLIVVPLLGGGEVRTLKEMESLRSGCLHIISVLDAAGVVLAFQSDLGPTQLASFIGQYPADRFGISYDTGSSAAHGFDSDQEIVAYGNRIVNVHVKDWSWDGGGLPGSGNSHLACSLSRLRRAGYQGNLILETPRAANSHAGLLVQYRAIAAACWNLVGADGFGAQG